MKAIINHGIPRSCKHWKGIRTAFLPASQLILPPIILILYASSKYSAVNQSPQDATRSQMPIVCQKDIVCLWRTVVSSSKERANVTSRRERPEKCHVCCELETTRSSQGSLCAMKFRGSSNTGGFVKHFGHHPERTRKPLEASFLWCSKGCYIVKDESKEVLSTYRELCWRPHL